MLVSVVVAMMLDVLAVMMSVRRLVLGAVAVSGCLRLGFGWSIDTAAMIQRGRKRRLAIVTVLGFCRRKILEEMMDSVRRRGREKREKDDRRPKAAQGAGYVFKRFHFGPALLASGVLSVWD
jgi:hypothetical protein